MAIMFRRELGIDFPPYSESEHGQPGSEGRHFVIMAEDGRAIGGLSARWREYEDAPIEPYH
jgi:hypothetical protein